MNYGITEIDQLIERTGVTYNEAKIALDKTDGNVVEAILFIEDGVAGAPQVQDDVETEANKESTVKEVYNKILDMVKKGNVAKIVFKKDDDIILNVPVNAGIASALVFTGATAVAIGAAIVAGCSIRIMKTDGGHVDINEMTSEGLSATKDKVSDLKDIVGEKASTIKNKVVKSDDDDSEEEVTIEITAYDDEEYFEDEEYNMNEFAKNEEVVEEVENNVAESDEDIIQ